MKAGELITKEDLQEFKSELLNDIRQILRSPKIPETREWLKSYEVRQLLKVSPGTLQSLRSNGTLSYSKVGGLMYYRYEDVLNLLNGKNGKVKQRFP